MERSWSMLAMLLVAAPSHAFSCTLPPPSMQLPDESDDAFEARSKAAARADDDEMHRTVQEKFGEQASRVTIGVITSVEALALPDGAGQKILVRPMKMIKGAPSDRPITLADRSLSTCGWVGGGTATHGKVGEYVVVFEGLDFGGGKTDSFGLLARESRHPFLLNALMDFGTEASRSEVRR